MISLHHLFLLVLMHISCVCFSMDAVIWPREMREAQKTYFKSIVWKIHSDSSALIALENFCKDPINYPTYRATAASLLSMHYRQDALYNDFSRACYWAEYYYALEALYTTLGSTLHRSITTSEWVSYLKEEGHDQQILLSLTDSNQEPLFLTHQR